MFIPGLEFGFPAFCNGYSSEFLGLVALVSCLLEISGPRGQIQSHTTRRPISVHRSSLRSKFRARSL